MRLKVQPHLSKLTPERLRLWTPSVIGFGAALGVTAILFTETIPRVRKDILSNIPVFGNYWKSKIKNN